MKRGHLSGRAAIVCQCLKVLWRRGFLATPILGAAVLIRKGPRRKAWIPVDRREYADIVALSPDGQLLAVSCRSRPGRLSAGRKRYLAIVEHLGGRSLIVRNATELEAALDQTQGTTA